MRNPLSRGTALIALVLSLSCGDACATDRGDLPAAAEALAAVLVNLESQVRTGSETPSQSSQRSSALWADLQSQMLILGTAMADVPVHSEPSEAVRAIDAAIIDVARAHARRSTAVSDLLDRYGKPSPGSELKAVVLPPVLQQEDLLPAMMPTWLMLLMAPRIEAVDFARPRVMQALSELRALDALPLLELRANQDALDRARLPLDLAAMHRIDPVQALTAYSRCIPRAGEAMAKHPQVRQIYEQAIRDAIGQDPAMGTFARDMAANASDNLVREVFASVPP